MRPRMGQRAGTSVGRSANPEPDGVGTATREDTEGLYSKSANVSAQGGLWSYIVGRPFSTDGETESQLGNVCGRGRLLISSFPISEKPRHWRPEAAVLPQALSPWPQHSPQTRTFPRSAWTQGLAPWADVPKETSDPLLRSVQLPRRRNWLPARGGGWGRGPTEPGRRLPGQSSLGWGLRSAAASLAPKPCLPLPFPQLLGTSEVFALDPFPPLWSTCSHKCGREPCQRVSQSPCLLAI